MEIAGLLVAWSIQAAGVMSPGPGVALLMGIGMASGRAAALWATAGIAICAGFYAALTAIGLAALLSQVRELILVVKVLGAAYLAWLSVQAFRKSAQPPAPPVARAVEAEGKPWWQFVTMGLAMQLANPKAIFFWIAIAALGGFQTASAATIAVFVLGAIAISFIGHGAWAVVLSSAPFRSLYARARGWVEAGLGVFFAFASFKIITSRI